MCTPLRPQDKNLILELAYTHTGGNRLLLIHQFQQMRNDCSTQHLTLISTDSYLLGKEVTTICDSEIFL